MIDMPFEMNVVRRIVFEISEATNEDLARIVFFDHNWSPVYIRFEDGRCFIDEEFAPDEIWKIAAELHGEDSPEKLRLSGEVTMRVYGLKDRILQPDGTLIVEYSFSSSKAVKKRRRQYGVSTIRRVEKTTRAEVRAQAQRTLGT